MKLVGRKAAFFVCCCWISSESQWKLMLLCCQTNIITRRCATINWMPDYFVEAIVRSHRLENVCSRSWNPFDKKKHVHTWLPFNAGVCDNKSAFHVDTPFKLRRRRSIPGMNPRKMQTEWTCHTVSTLASTHSWKLLNQFHSISRVKAWAKVLLPSVESNAAQKRCSNWNYDGWQR